jgi:hypothetical protein
MAFTGGITRAKSGSNNGTGQKQQQNSYDRLVEVTGYDLPRKVMYAKDDNGKEFEVYINPETVVRAEQNNREKGYDLKNVNWQGHSIDAKMERGVPAGSKAVLLRSKVIKKDAGNGKSSVEAHWIGGVPNPEPDKTFQGIISVSYRIKDNKKRINRAFVWQRLAIDSNDGTAIEKLKEEIDTQNSLNQQKIKGLKGEYTSSVPTIGVQFRALMKTDKLYSVDNQPIYEVVDTSSPFSWIPGPLDEEGNEIRNQAHSLTGDEMLAYAEGYVEHISNHPAFSEHLNEMKVEICPFRVYPASENDANLLNTARPANDDKNPLFQMAHRRNFLDMDQTDQIEGMNAGVNGILQCGPSKTDKVGGVLTEIPQYWVSKIHANNARGHVHSFVRTSEGNKAEPHPSLALIKTEQLSHTASGVSHVADSQPQHHQEPEQVVSRPQQSAPAAVQSKVDLDDPFGDDDDAFNPLSAPPAVEVKAPPKTGFKFGLKKDD